jgi:hypothetical protein
MAKRLAAICSAVMDESRKICYLLQLAEIKSCPARRLVKPLPFKPRMFPQGHIRIGPFPFPAPRVI